MVNPELRMENVSVGRGCFELWYGECSVSVNVSVTLSSPVYTPRYDTLPAAHSTLLTEHILATQINPDTVK